MGNSANRSTSCRACRCSSPNPKRACWRDRVKQRTLLQPPCAPPRGFSKQQFGFSWPVAAGTQSRNIAEERPACCGAVSARGGRAVRARWGDDPEASVCTGPSVTATCTCLDLAEQPHALGQVDVAGRIGRRKPLRGDVDFRERVERADARQLDLLLPILGPPGRAQRVRRKRDTSALFAPRPCRCAAPSVSVHGRDGLSA